MEQGYFLGNTDDANSVPSGSDAPSQKARGDCWPMVVRVTVQVSSVYQFGQDVLRIHERSTVCWSSYWPSHLHAAAVVVHKQILPKLHRNIVDGRVAYAVKEACSAENCATSGYTRARAVHGVHEFVP